MYSQAGLIWINSTETSFFDPEHGQQTSSKLSEPLTSTCLQINLSVCGTLLYVRGSYREPKGGIVDLARLPRRNDGWARSDVTPNTPPFLAFGVANSGSRWYGHGRFAEFISASTTHICPRLGLTVCLLEATPTSVRLRT